MRNKKFITFLLSATMLVCTTSCDVILNDNDGISISVKSRYNVGDDASSLSNDMLVSRSDKENVYYNNGEYIIVRDDVVRQIQYCDVISLESTIIDYLNDIEDFSQDNATIQCLSMEGNETKFDMSTTWENCTFGELVAYWKTTDSKGIMVTLYPGNTAIINEYLYYSDLSELIDYSESSEDD